MHTFVRRGVFWGALLLWLWPLSAPAATEEAPGRQLARQAGATLRAFAGMKHELHHEPARRQVWETVHAFLRPYLA